MTLGVDYAFVHPNVGQLYDAGVRFAGRYVGAGTADKRLTRDEVLALNQAGIPVVSLVEGYSNDALRGYGTGHDHATAALRDLAALGAPTDRPMYFAVDFDMQPGQWSAVFDYLRGCAAVIGWDRVGVYGGLRTVQLAHERGGVRWLFQTYAWSNGVWYPAATFRQTHNGQLMAGANVDLCWSIESDIGQWSIVGPAKPEGVQDMFLVKTDDSDTVFLSNGVNRRPITQWSTCLGLAQRGLVSLPPGANPQTGDGIVVVIHATLIDDWAGPVPGGLVDQAAIQASASTGAAAGVQGALGDGSVLAAGVASAVGQALGTLRGSFTLSGPLTGPDGGARPV